MPLTKLTTHYQPTAGQGGRALALHTSGENQTDESAANRGILGGSARRAGSICQICPLEALRLAPVFGRNGVQFSAAGSSCIPLISTFEGHRIESPDLPDEGKGAYGGSSLAGWSGIKRDHAFNAVGVYTLHLRLDRRGFLACG